MKIYHCAQGSPEWTRLRLGIPTASSFDKIFTPGGKPSGANTQEKYLHALLYERATGEPDADFKSSWMERGADLEARAVGFYQFQRDMETETVGFIANDAGTIGGSPDRTVGEPGLLEIKVPKGATHIGYLLESGGAYGEYRVQVQGQLWIAERQWCDVVSYNDKMPMALYRVERDDVFIEGLSKAVEKFSATLEAMSLELVERGWLKADWKPEVRTANSQADAINEMREAMRSR